MKLMKFALFSTALLLAPLAHAQYVSDSGTVGKSKTVALIADDQAVTATGVGYISLTSDNATAANRTFTLTASALVGHRVTLVWDDTDAGEIEDTSIQKLTGNWTPARYDTLTVVSDGTNWNEISRSSATVTSAMVTDATLTAADLATSAVATDEILDATIAAIDIATGAVETTEILDSTIAVVDVAENIMREATGTLTQANLLAAASFVTAIAAPGSGKVIVVDEVELFHSYSTAAYADGSDLALEYGTSGDNIMLVVDSFVTATASASAMIKPSAYDLDGSTGTGSGFDVTSNANKPVQFQATNFTSGNVANVIKWRIRYHVITLAT